MDCFDCVELPDGRTGTLVDEVPSIDGIGKTFIVEVSDSDKSKPFDMDVDLPVYHESQLKVIWSSNGGERNQVQAL